MSAGLEWLYERERMTLCKYATFSEKSGDAVRKAHARRADKKADERHNKHRERERGNNIPGAGLCFHGRSLLSLFDRRLCIMVF